jgi:hypothetical protein
MSWILNAVELDLQIAELETRLHVIRARRNAITPFYRLPNEILERILLMLQLDLYELDTRTSTQDIRVDRDGKWARAMLICRRFREAALDSTVLWSSINLERKYDEWVDLCLERSRAHPLVIEGVIRDSYDNETKRTFNLFHWAQQARLHVDPDHSLTYGDSYRHERSMYEGIQALLESKNSSLTRLEVLNASRDWRYYQSPYIEITRNLLGGGPSNLHTLLLASANIIDFPFMPLLERMTLQRYLITPGGQNLRQALLQTPALSYLSLEDSEIGSDVTRDDMDIHSFHKISDEPPVPLSHLSELRFVCSTLQIGRIIHVMPNPLNLFVLHDDTLQKSNFVRFASSYPLVISDYVLHRIEQYLADAVNDDVLPPVSIHLAPGNPRFFFVSLTTTASDPGLRQMNMHLLLPPSGASLAGVVRFAQTVSVSDASRLVDVVDVLSACRLEHLRIPNLVVGLEDRLLALTEGADVTLEDVHLSTVQRDTLAKIMQNHVDTQGGPIQTLTLVYDKEHSLPTIAVQCHLTKSWKDEGLAEDIEWVQTE